MLRNPTARLVADVLSLTGFVFAMVAFNSIIVAAVLGYVLGATAAARMKWIVTGEWKWP